MSAPYTFPTAANYNNLPNGVFSPTLFSKKAQKAFRKTAVAQDITNSEYFGEIANFGDSVRILKEPEIVVNAYRRGTQITPQDLTDTDFILTVDQANYFAFKLDDIEIQQAHVNWMELATNRAAYKMADQYDLNVLAYASGYTYSATTGLWTVNSTASGTNANTLAGTDELLSANKLTRASFISGGGATTSVAIGTAGTFDITPLQLLNRFNRLLDINNVDPDGRWVVVDPVFKELLLDENSKYVNNDFATNQNAGGQLYTNRLIHTNIRGFRVYESNNLPKVGTGPGTAATSGSTSNYGVILAGQDSALAAAQQIDKTEKYRDPNSFADIVRGMNLYGRKILRPEALLRVWWNSNVG
jgi:hypothetical protein